MNFLRLWTLPLALAGAALAQESTTALQNPFQTDEDREAGEKTFVSQCASCHGRDGRGTTAGPDLSTGQFKRASTDEGIFQIINKGIPGTTMPGFQINARPMWQVVAFIRSLSRNRDTRALPGDPQKGAALFTSTGCAGCHEIDGKGGHAGPSLSSIGRRRTLAELRQSITDPQASASSEFWTARIETKDGRKFAGRRLNEDTFSIQILDGKAGLVTVLKSDQPKIEIDRRSPMPPLALKLTPAQLNDLTAFLATRGIQQ
jgi:putative heme-binding domain-containing protein